MTVKVEGLKETADRLRALPARLGSKGGGPLRFALARAANVLVEEARQLAPVRTGNLQENIISKRHRNPRVTGATESYSIGMRGGTRKLANNRRNRGTGRAGKIVIMKDAGLAFYGRFVELGVPARNIPAQPFLRPALTNKGRAAVDEFRKQFLRAVEAAERKLAKGR